MTKPLNWFEIPTRNIEKARDFYEAVFGVKMTTGQIGSATYSAFPYDRETATGGALIQDRAYQPGIGPLLYRLMRRADRLFQIVQHLRARRLTTAAQLAQWLSVSERTIYRDVRDLSVSGVPVRGEAGVGYELDRSYDLRPIMFTPDEIDAAVFGLRMVEAFCGPDLTRHVRSALAKSDIRSGSGKKRFVLSLWVSGRHGTVVSIVTARGCIRNACI